MKRCTLLGKETTGKSGSTRIWLQLDRPQTPDGNGPYIDALWPSTGPERRELSAEEFVKRGESLLDMALPDLASRSRQHDVVEARRLKITLGRERRVQSTKDLVSVLDKSADTVTYIQREGAPRRLEDKAFLQRYENLDAGLAGGGR